MALTKCKECGGQVSTKAKNCPACGAKVQKKVGVLGWIFVLVVVLPIAWQFGKGIDKGSEEVTKSAQTAAPAAPAKPVWESTESIDKMTDKKVKFTSIQSLNSINFDFPYQKPGGSKLSITFRRNGQDLDAILIVEKGQLQCSRLSCTFDLRAGDGPVTKWNGVQSTTRESNIMFVSNAKKFEEEIKNGGRFRLGLEFFKSGVQVFEFDTSGYPGI